VEALELLKPNPEIVLLVSDIKMPRMDGYALVTAGLEFKPDLKVLLMTGYAQDPLLQFLKARGIPDTAQALQLGKALHPGGGDGGLAFLLGSTRPAAAYRKCS
jgi:CheY-like chemotaxis protein